MNLPFQKSWSIDNGRIIGGQYPGSPDVAAQHDMLQALLDCGITHFVNLQQPHEATGAGPFRDYMPLVQPIAAEHGRVLAFRRFAIMDGGTPSQAMMIDCLDHIDAILADAGKPYVHCWGGCGRTGTVIGCWLVRHGRTPDEAIAEMAHGRRGRGFAHPAPENAKQIRFVHEWATIDSTHTQKRGTHDHDESQPQEHYPDTSTPKGLV